MIQIFSFVMQKMGDVQHQRDSSKKNEPIGFVIANLFLRKFLYSFLVGGFNPFEKY